MRCTFKPGREYCGVLIDPNSDYMKLDDGGCLCPVHVDFVLSIPIPAGDNGLDSLGRGKKMSSKPTRRSQQSTFGLARTRAA